MKYKQSRWTPEKGRDPWLDFYLEEVIQIIVRGVSKNRKGNLGDKEEQALAELMSDQDTVIRPADQGSGVVVMDTGEYLKRLREKLIMMTRPPTESKKETRRKLFIRRSKIWQIGSSKELTLANIYTGTSSQHILRRDIYKGTPNFTRRDILCG